jgi:hypothetical protein
MNYGYKQHSYVVGHIARFLLCRPGLASVPACVGFESSVEIGQPVAVSLCLWTPNI